MSALAPPGPAAPSLHRNRDFVLLQIGQLLSAGGSQIAAIAYPLLVLAETGSPAKTGLVGAVQLLARAVFALPAGLVADRVSRKRVMIAADVLRMVTISTLAMAIVADELTFSLIVVVAFLESTGGPFFQAAQNGALRSVVPARQLPDAINVVTGRQAAVNLGGPAVGGALFGLARAIPFVVDALSYAFSSLSLLLMRTPFQEERATEEAPLRAQLAEGFHFLWQQPFIRTTALVFAPLNLLGLGMTLALVVTAKGEGLSGTVVGLLVASFGAGILLGSFISPIVRRALPARAVLLLEVWMWPMPLAFCVRPSAWVLAVSLLPAAMAIPSTDSVVYGYQLAITPDRLVGRVNSVFSAIVLSFAPLGPLLAGFLLDASTARVTIALFGGGALLVAVVATISPALRSARLDGLAGAAAATARAGGA
jgi:fucose permease